MSAVPSWNLSSVRAPVLSLHAANKSHRLGVSCHDLRLGIGTLQNQSLLWFGSDSSSLLDACISLWLCVSSVDYFFTLMKRDQVLWDWGLPRNWQKEKSTPLDKYWEAHDLPQNHTFLYSQTSFEQIHVLEETYICRSKLLKHLLGKIGG